MRRGWGMWSTGGGSRRGRGRRGGRGRRMLLGEKKGGIVS